MAKSQLHPGARWLFRVRGYLVAIPLFILLSWFVIPMIIVIAQIARGWGAGASIGLLIGLVFLFILFVAIIAEIYARMAYNRWFYEFTPTNLKIERGIIWKRYSNVPYERVQNVDIHRGIIARICGFSSVNIKTAGYSMGYTSHGGIGAGSEGYLPAVTPEGAEKIREFLMKKISRHHGKGQGL